jgi:hypothetical protein
VSSVAQNLIPKPPQEISLPLFARGTVLNIPSTVLPDGAVVRASNWNITAKGPSRRVGSIKFAGGATVSYAPVRDTVQLFKSDGTQRIGVLDTRFLYLQSGAVLYRQNYGTSAGTIKTSGTHLVGNGSTLFTAALLRGGDYVSIKPGTASAQELLIASVISKSHLTLAVAPSPGPFGAGSAYKVFKAFDYVKSRFVDYTLCDGKTVFADGARPFQAWDGTTMGAFSAPLVFVPNCVAFWQDRLWGGYIRESDSTLHRSRIRWSKTTDHTSFIGSPDSQWQDRPYSPGELLRLVPMGKLLIGYYTDRIDIGRPTNYAGDILPVAFETLDTGGAGLVGMKAVVPFFDGHFLVMDDGIKFFSASSGVPQNIGEDVWKDATKGLKTFQAVIASVDWQNDSIVFAFPDVSGAISVLWNYNYKSKGWSRMEIPCTSVSTIAQTTAPTIDGAVGTIDAQTASFDDLASSFKKQLAFGRAGAISILDVGASDDFDNTTIQAVLETGDFSWQLPNTKKTVFRLTLKTDRIMEVETIFQIEGSTNRGTSWKALGNLVVAQGDDENQVGFKLTGPMIRFRISCGTRVLPFTIAEVVLRVRARGRELIFSSAD